MGGSNVTGVVSFRCQFFALRAAIDCSSMFSNGNVPKLKLLFDFRRLPFFLSCILLCALLCILLCALFRMLLCALLCFLRFLPLALTSAWRMSRIDIFNGDDLRAFFEFFSLGILYALGVTIRSPAAFLVLLFKNIGQWLGFARVHV